MESHGESWSDMVESTISDKQLDEEFYNGYGCVEGLEFTVWSNGRVYFPICYDGSEWCGSVSRNPDGKPTSHQGGG